MEEILHQLGGAGFYSIHSMIDWWFIVLIITNDPDNACD